MSTVFTIFSQKKHKNYLEKFLRLCYTKNTLTKKQEAPMRDQIKVVKIVTISVVVFIFLLAVSLIINLIKISGLNSQKAQLADKLGTLESQIEANEGTIAYMSSDTYVDQYAREYLGLIGEGETPFVGK